MSRPSKLASPFFRRNKYEKKPIVIWGSDFGREFISNLCGDCGGGRYVITLNPKTRTCRGCGKETLE